MGVIVPNFASSTEDRVSGAQIVDGGLRFDGGKGQYLTRTPSSAGNRSTWTWSGWVKKTKNGDQGRIFNVGATSGSPVQTAIYFVTTDTFTIERYQGSGTDYYYASSSAVYRDNSAWYHIVAVWDTTNSISTDRLRIYINGQRITSFSASAFPTPGFDGEINTTNIHYLGTASNGYSFDGLMSQLYFIDGQTLGPEYFGYTDPLTNTWRPKKYTGNFNYSPAVELFPSYTELNWGFGTTESGWAITNSDKTATYTGSGTYSDVFTTSLDSSTTYAFQLNVTVSESFGGWFFTDDTNITPSTHPDERNGGNSLGMRSSDSAAGTYGTFSTANGTSDGQNQISNIPAPSNGSKTDFVINMSARKVWVKSSSSSTWIGGGDPSNSSSTASFLLPSGTIYFAFVSYNGTATITMDTLTSEETGVNSFYLPFDGSAPIGQDQSGRGNNWTPVNFGGSNTLEKATGALPILNTDGGGKVARPGVFGSEENKYYTVTTANGSIYQFDITSGDNPSLSFIRGATYKFDYSSFTGHPLLFSSTNPDSSTTAYTDGTSTASNVISFTVPHDAPDTLYYYCQNHPTSMNGSISITTDETKADPYASNCVFAVPCVGNNNDVSAFISCTSSTKAITTRGNAAASSAQSNFYGGSFAFDGTDDDFYADTPGAIGTGDFTLECWVYFNNLSSSQGVVDTRTNTNTNGFALLGRSNGTVSMADGTSLIGDAISASAGRWMHLAGSRSGSSLKFFVDGKLSSTVANSTNFSNDNIIVGTIGGGTEDLNGYVQDVRLYLGVAKYTSNFIPASTDPDIVPDSPSGVSYSSNLTQITDGAVSFDGSGDYLSISDGSDLELGSGDFTIEGYYYFKNTGSSGTTFWGKWASVPGRSYAFSYVKSSGKYVFAYSTDGTNENLSADFVSQADIERWVHFAAVRSGTSLKVYRDGKEIIDHNISTTTIYNSSANLMVGRLESNSNYDINGFVSNFRLIKGTALYTSNFTPPSAPLTDVTNTKLLCCQSPTSATAFDVSPGSITANGNAAATNFNPFTDDIDTQRGKQSGYATLNPLDKTSSTVLSAGNLTYSSSSSAISNARSTLSFPSSGKYYFESTNITQSSGYPAVGIARNDVDVSGGYNVTGSMVIRNIASQSRRAGFEYDANAHINMTPSATPLEPGDTLQFLVDCDARKVYVGINGTLYGRSDATTMTVVSPSDIASGTNPAYELLSGYSYFAWTSAYSSSSSGTINFGQNPFKFPPPAGFQPLTLANTPRPTIVRPDQYVGIVTYSGDGNSGRKVTGLNFNSKPDLVWIKVRNQTNSHYIFDTVRGADKALFSDLTDDENDYSGSGGRMPSFDYNGFTVNYSSSTGTNASGSNYVAWSWKAGGNSNTFNIDDVGYDTAEAAGLTAGTITPTGASVNTKSGFSIITWTGNGVAGASVSHGLGISPSLIITKDRDATKNWNTYHKSLGATNIVLLNVTNASAAGDNYYNTTPTSTVFYNHAGNPSFGSQQNIDGNRYVSYCWAEIPGFSKFGSYIGNGVSGDGPYIHLGFRPRFFMHKRTDNGDANQDWRIWDSERVKYNAIDIMLQPNDSAGDYQNSAVAVDFLSNGVKIRATDTTNNNASGGTYIYAAFAEAPTFNLYGAQANAR